MTVSCMAEANATASKNRRSAEIAHRTCRAEPGESGDQQQLGAERPAASTAEHRQRQAIDERREDELQRVREAYQREQADLGLPRPDSVSQADSGSAKAPNGRPLEKPPASTGPAGPDRRRAPRATRASETRAAGRGMVRRRKRMRDRASPELLPHQLGQRGGLRSGADVADHLGGGDGGNARAALESQPVRQGSRPRTRRRHRSCPRRGRRARLR